jgi:hypothetical protein
MRVFFGIILGIIISLGAAYIHDANIPVTPAVASPTDPGQPSPTLEQRRIVNWDVLGAITREQTEFVRQQWNKIFNT